MKRNQKQWFFIRRAAVLAAAILTATTLWLITVPMGIGVLAAGQSLKPANDPAKQGVTVNAGAGIAFTDQEHNDPSLFLSNVTDHGYVGFTISGSPEEDYFEYDFGGVSVPVSSVRLVRFGVGNEVTGLSFAYQASSGEWINCGGSDILVNRNDTNTQSGVWGSVVTGGERQVLSIPTQNAAASSRFRIYVKGMDGGEARMRLMNPQSEGTASGVPRPEEAAVISAPETGRFRINESPALLYNNPSLTDVLANDTDYAGTGTYVVPSGKEDGFLFGYPKEVNFTGVGLISKSSATRAITKMELYVSEDGVNWGSALPVQTAHPTLPWTMTHGSGAGKFEEIQVKLAAPAQGRYMKVKILEYKQQWNSFFVVEVCPLAESVPGNEIPVENREPEDILPHPILTLDGVTSLGEHNAPGNGIQTWVTADSFQHDAKGRLHLPLTYSGNAGREGLTESSYQKGWVVYDYRGKVKVSEIYMNGWWAAGLKTFTLEYLDSDGVTWVNAGSRLSLDCSVAALQPPASGTVKIYTLPEAITTMKLRLRPESHGPNNAGPVMSLVLPRGQRIDDRSAAFTSLEELETYVNGYANVGDKVKYDVFVTAVNTCRTEADRWTLDQAALTSALTHAENQLAEFMKTVTDGVAVTTTYTLSEPVPWLADGLFVPVKLRGTGSVTIHKPQNYEVERVVVISKNGKTAGPDMIGQAAAVWQGYRNYQGTSVAYSAVGDSFVLTFTPRKGVDYIEIDEILLEGRYLTDQTLLLQAKEEALTMISGLTPAMLEKAGVKAEVQRLTLMIGSANHQEYREIMTQKQIDDLVASLSTASLKQLVGAGES